MDLEKALKSNLDNSTSNEQQQQLQQHYNSYDHQSNNQYNNQQSSKDTRIEYIEWISCPLSISLIQPFLVSILNDTIEIHELITFKSIQRIIISSLSSIEISFCSCMVELTNGSSQHGYICNGEQLSALKLIPIARQVCT